MVTIQNINQKTYYNFKKYIKENCLVPFSCTEKGSDIQPSVSWHLIKVQELSQTPVLYFRMCLFTGWFCSVLKQTGAPSWEGKPFTLWAQAKPWCVIYCPSSSSRAPTISSQFCPLQIHLVPDPGVKRGHFSWVTAPRPWGTPSCADLNAAVLQHGCFIWNPAQPSPWAQGQWNKGIPSPLQLK